MKLKTKIISGNILFSLFVGIISVIGTMGIMKIEKNFGSITEDVLPTVKVLEDVRFAGLRIVSSVSEHGLLLKYSVGKPSEADSISTERKLIGEGKDLYNKSFAAYERLAKKESDENLLLEEIRSAGDALIRSADILMSMMVSGRSPDVIMEMKERFELDEMAFLKGLNRALDHEYLELTKAKHEESAALKTAVNAAMLISFLTLIIAITIGLALSNGIVRPLKYLQECSERIGRGDFEIPIMVRSRDELGELAQVIERMRLDIKNARDSLNLAKLEVEQRNKELEEANSELEAFNYSVSHDLRSPLQRIGGYTSLVIMESAEKLDRNDIESLEKVCTSVNQMSRLIDDLLDFSMLARSELYCQEIDLTALLKGIAAELKLSEQHRNVEFKIMDGMTAFGDPGLIKVLLTNLAGNAWKYTRRKESAYIEIVMENQEGMQVYSVRDNGDGFEMKHADKLFTPFQRLHSSIDFEGTGIGLATAKRIVTRHGGKIWAEAAQGVGATFHFTLKDV